MADLRSVVRACVKDLEACGPGCIERSLDALKDAGAVRHVHVGDETIGGDAQKTLEWYAGQLLDILESRSFVAMNSILNACDRFAPEVPNGG